MSSTGSTMKWHKIAQDDRVRDMMEGIGRAYQKHREYELSLKFCPKCQFEAVKDEKCLHCGYTYMGVSTSKHDD